MSEPSTNKAKEGNDTDAPASAPGNISFGSFKNIILLILVFASVVIIAQLGALIVYVVEIAAAMPMVISNGQAAAATASTTPDTTTTTTTTESHEAAEEHAKTSASFAEGSVFNSSGVNVCEGKNPNEPSVQCTVDAMTNVGEQSGANVTKGYNGSMKVTSVPITTEFWKVGMCPVNVHWHLGTEHLSVGEYDEEGTGPSMDGSQDRPGYQCRLYDATDPKFTTPFLFQHCHGMEVGQTYEVHWPHSAAGACGTINQYQTPFLDGVFCMDGVLTDTASQVGVQAQVFTVVNDEDYYWPDLFRGMIVDRGLGMGQDVAKYTGSTTGDKFNNDICSPYSPITWQVDRKCHLISATSFDKLCADMAMQRDDMTDDMHPHGSRELVDDKLAANNHQDLLLRRRRQLFLRSMSA